MVGDPEDHDEQPDHCEDGPGHDATHGQPMPPRVRHLGGQPGVLGAQLLLQLVQHPLLML